jgi:hypothetical protein
MVIRDESTNSILTVRILGVFGESGKQLTEMIFRVHRNRDVVFSVDLHRMREGPRVEIVSDLAQEFSITVELKQLCCLRHMLCQ